LTIVQNQLVAVLAHVSDRNAPADRAGRRQN
jgi:hypothetical protein